MRIKIMENIPCKRYQKIILQISNKKLILQEFEQTDVESFDSSLKYEIALLGDSQGHIIQQDLWRFFTQCVVK